MRLRITNRAFFLLLLLMVSCFSMRDISTQNMSYVYRTSDQKFHPEFIAYNENDSIVRLFLKVLPSEFLYIKHDDDKFKADINVVAQIIASYESTKVIDSSSADFSFDLNEKSGSRIVSMIIPFNSTGTYLIHCKVADTHKGIEDDFFIPLDRLSKASRQDFLVTGPDSIPIFRNYFYSTEAINIYFKNDTVKDFWCKYYKREFPLAAPPFTFDVRSEFDYKPDSLFKISRDNFAGLNFPNEGFYHIQTDSVGKSGFTLFRFSGSFPEITSPKQMIESVRYLTNKKEFEEMKNSPSPKAAIDNFWLSHGGNEEKTRALIKKYYGRIREANRFFTSYTEGWRTDRGMIFTLFGSPGTVYRNSESETWTYGTPNSTLALNFFFVKVNNPFTENDFTLSRSPTYESNWYRAVEVWRQGRAYNSFY